MTSADESMPLLEPFDATERPLLVALDAAEPKPHPKADRADKKNYAQRLSNATAQLIADELRHKWSNITPNPDGGEQEARVRTAGGGQKRLDVKVTDLTLGLLLSVSIKTYSFQDYDSKKDRLGRYTKNIVRNDHELRGEASVLHQRQPYAVLIGVLFTPVETALDGKGRGKSSFAHHVQTLRKRAGRGRQPVKGLPSDAWVLLGGQDPRSDLFERVYIGLYESEGERRGHVRFVDVERPVPMQGAPAARDTLSLAELCSAIIAEVDERNEAAPMWVEPEDDGEG